MSGNIKKAGTFRMRAVMVLPLLLLVPLTAEAELYSWVDRSGNHFIADNLAKVPEEYRGGARKLDQSGEMVSFESRSREASSPVRVDPVRDQNGRDEQWWRDQVKNLRAQIKTEEDNLAYYDDRRRQCEEEQKNHLRYWRNCSRLNEEGRKRSEWNLERLKQRLEGELPEQARKAGALPGWLRE